jgi:hypothetical protein
VGVESIGRLHAAYGDVVTRRAWDELDALFDPACPVSLALRDGRSLHFVGPGAIGEFIAGAIERFSFFEFVPLNWVADVDDTGDTASGRLWITELRTDAATGAWSQAFGLYEDRLALVDGRWVYAERRYTSLAQNPA